MSLPPTCARSARPRASRTRTPRATPRRSATTSSKATCPCRHQAAAEREAGDRRHRRAWNAEGLPGHGTRHAKEPYDVWHSRKTAGRPSSRNAVNTADQGGRARGRHRGERPAGLPRESRVADRGGDHRLHQRVGDDAGGDRPAGPLDGRTARYASRHRERQRIHMVRPRQTRWRSGPGRRPSAHVEHRVQHQLEQQRHLDRAPQLQRVPQCRRHHPSTVQRSPGQRHQRRLRRQRRREETRQHR